MTTTFSPVSIPTLAYVERIIYAPELSLWVAVGGGGIITSPDGITWTTRLTAAVDFTDVVWAASIGKFVAAGDVDTVYTSTNGISWTSHTVGVKFFPSALAWSASQTKFVLSGAGYSSYYSDPNNSVWTSPDGVTWTGRGVPTLFDYGTAAAYSPTLDLFVIGDDCGRLWTSPDGITWTGRTTPFNPCHGTINRLVWLPGQDAFFACGSAGTAHVTLAKSTDGITWTAVTNPINGFGTWPGVWDIVEVGSRLFLTGSILPNDDGAVYESSDGGSTWTRDVTPNDSSINNPFFALGADATSFTVLAGALSPTLMSRAFPVIPPEPGNTTRFFEGYPWRFVFTDIAAPAATPPTTGSVSTTWADGLITGRTITKTLNQPATIEASVWPDDKRVNELYQDGFPVVAQNNRLVYCFRREGGSPPWVCRAAGILMSPEDQGDPDTPLTHFVAYDPWQYLQGRPVVDATGAPPSTDYGLNLTGYTGNEIVTTLLKNTIENQGPCFIDAGNGSRIGEGSQYQNWGGTAFYQGTIEVTDTMVYNAQTGALVSDVWNDMCDTGTLDIVLTPIYDPINRPGYTHELNIYQLAGNDLPSVVFGWDQMNRSLTNADRQHSGVPGDFANLLLYYAGQGAPIGITAQNSGSIDTFGTYWMTQTFPEISIPSGQNPYFLANQALKLAKQGKRTFTVDATPERAPVPLDEYDIGDRVGIWTTNRLRVATTNSFVDPVQAQRIESIPIVIDDDGIERVQAMITSPDFRTVDLLVGDQIQTLSIAGMSAAVVAGVRTHARKTISKLKKPGT